MEQVVNKARSFREAEQWDRQQYLEMTSDERLAVSAILARSVYGNDTPDIRTERRIVKRHLHDKLILP